MKFIHLHNHSHYSILDGAITIDKMVEKAVEFGMPGIALTDHGNMFGAIEFYEKARARGIKPIIGQEFYTAPGSRFDRESKSHGKDSSYHLLLLAKDLKGYKNLVRLSSIGYLEGFYYKPRIDLEVLEKHSEGLICASACLGGEIPSLILQKKTDEAQRAAGRYAEIFGKDHFYLELQDHGIPEQAVVNRELIALSDALNLPLVATNDCHYLNAGDSFSHEVLLCIQTGKILDDESRMRFSSDKFYIRSPQEMEALFAEVPDALYNTHNIYEMINLELELGNAILPNFEVPENYTLDSYLRHLVSLGAIKRYGSPVPDEVARRIEYELSVITKMKFSGYFLIVWDFINYARKESIPVGPGRGSAAGSIVSYCLGITALDPLRYNLLFERFLNPDRNEMPDMDIDFCAIRREEVIDYVKRKYGEDHVSQIITFNKMKAKAVIKDVARVLNIPFADANIISKQIKEETLQKELEGSSELKKIYTETERGRSLIDISLTLEGLVRSAGKHAAGVVISREPIIEYVPLYRDTKDGSISSQYEKMTLEKAGLVKMDFLGLKNLSIIDKCLKLIRKTRGIEIDIDALPLDDGETFTLLQRADTLGVFQLESTGMQNILRKLGPTDFEDIIAIVALYRPGPLDSGMVDDYITRKRNPKKINYLHPSLEPILRDTLGVIVYQEQVMLISQVMGNFTLPEADKLRKAMSKKNPEIIDQMEEKFIKGSDSKKIDRKLAEEIFDMIRKFGRYGFNKSHSAAYAMVSYQTAYLKAHYPIEYMASLLSASTDNQDDIVKYVGDCRTANIQVLPPDINRSEFDFSIEEKAIRFGFAAIKGVGEKAIETILNARSQLQGFAHLRSFLENIDLFALNKGVLESLIKAGAFDSLHKNRAQIFHHADLILEGARKLQEDRATGQAGLFDSDEEFSGDAATLPFDLPYLRDWHDNEKLAFEKEVLGLYLSGHPLARYETEIKTYSCTSLARLSEEPNPDNVSVVGVLYNLKVRTSKNGRPFAGGMIEDLEGNIDVVFFPHVYEKYRRFIVTDEPVLIRGKLEIENDIAKKIIANEVQSLREIRRESISALHIRLDLVGMDEKLLKELKFIISTNGGNCPVYLHVRESKADEKTIRVHPTYNITPSDTLIQELSHLVGRESIRYSLRNAH